MLKAGSENKKIILHLISILDFRHDGLKSALVEYYCVGGKSIEIAKINGTHTGNLYRAMKRLNKLVDDIEILQKMRLGLL